MNFHQPAQYNLFECIKKDVVSLSSKNLDMTTAPNHTRIYEYHEIADIYPLCSEEEIRKMAQSILEQGQLYSIKLYGGKILDGRNMYRACKIAGVEPYFEHWDGTFYEAIEYVTAENEHRRHLTSSQKAACAILKEELINKITEENNKLQKSTSPKKRQKGFQSSVTQLIESHKEDRYDPDKLPTKNKDKVLHKNSKNDRTTNAKLAKMVGTNRQYIEDVKKIWKNHPDKFEEVRAGNKTIPEVKKLLKVEEREAIRDERRKKAQQVIIPGNIEIYQGDCMDLSQKLKTESVDAIITDPPYPYEFIDCWSNLGIIAKRVLKPGGFCLAYAGVMYLPEVMNRLGEHLEYFWTISMILSGPGSKAHARSVVNRYRPILVYVKPPANENVIKKNRTHFVDIIQGTGRQKDMHEWQQSEEELRYLFEKFTEPKNTILDPFAGSGTVLAMAKNMERHGIGFEIEKEHIDTIKVRLSCDISAKVEVGITE